MPIAAWNRSVVATLIISSLAACADMREGAADEWPPSSLGAPQTGVLGDDAAVPESPPLDDMAATDLLSEGHDLFEADVDFDVASVPDDVSFVRREDVPEDALEELDRLADQRIIAKDLIGSSDGRVAVKSTADLPYRSIVKVYTRYAKGGKLYGCSGTLIAADAVLTASHCVFNSSRVARGYAYSVTVIPGMYPKSPRPSSGVLYEAPFGTAVGAKLFVPSGYIANETDTWNRVGHDYAVIRLKSPLRSAGTRKLGVLASPLNKSVVLTGYHGDRDKGLRQYTSRDQIRKAFSAGVLNHYADTEHGASGSGIVGTGAWADKIFAVHSSGFESYNAAAAISDSNYRVISDWVRRAL